VDYLISLSIIPSRFIQVVYGSEFPSFLRLNNISLHFYTTFCLFILSVVIKTGSPYIAKADLKFVILLPQLTPIIPATQEAKIRRIAV
jgi:hypothetical protein